jgi:hypothetical protein
MEKEKQEIIAYQVGEHLLCPQCYEKNLKILSVHEIELPAKPAKREDIEGFVCDQCKVIKGDYRVQSYKELKDLQMKLEIQDELEKGKPIERRGNSLESLIDFEDMLNALFSKIVFIEDFFVHSVPEDELISEKGRSGFYHILVDIEDDLKFFSSQLAEKRQKGLIIEKKAS